MRPWIWWACCLVGSASLGGCEEGPPPEPTAGYIDVQPGPTSMRRLTLEQLESSVHDVFGAHVVVPAIAEPDVAVGGLVAIGAGQTSFSPRGTESIESAAYSIARQALDGAHREALLGCTPSGTRDDACAGDAITRIGRLAWRRPLEVDERTALVEVAGEAAETLGDFHEGMAFALAALVQAPQFLFRVEVGVGADDGTRRFTDFELASRLSYFLWNTTPDAALLDAAEQGALSTDEGYRLQAERLLNDPRARDGVRAFFVDHYRLYELEEMKKDPGVFEHYSTDLGHEAMEETLRVLDEIIWETDADYRDILTTPVTYVTPLLAAIYTIPAPDPDGFARVTLPADRQRAGLLGQASFLGAHAHRVSSSASLRGKAIRTILLCQSVPAPPVNVDTSIPEPSGTTRTLRERVAEHLEDPTCAGCHTFIDPIGLGLENYDGIGRWRDRDNGAEIDASGNLDGVEFQTPRELGQVVREHPSFAPCLVQTLTRYALGRRETGNERLRLMQLVRRFEARDHRIRPLLMDLVTSPLFREAGPLQEAQ